MLGDLVRLRALEPSDADALWRWSGAPEVVRWMDRLRGAEPETGIADLDIYLGEKDYWGHGYGTDTMRTICRYGFGKMRLHKITLAVVTENEAAHHVYLKVGFADEGRLRQVFRRDGRWYDMYTMGLLEGELR